MIMAIPRSQLWHEMMISDTEREFLAAVAGVPMCLVEKGTLQFCFGNLATGYCYILQRLRQDKGAFTAPQEGLLVTSVSKHNFNCFEFPKIESGKWHCAKPLFSLTLRVSCTQHYDALWIHTGGASFECRPHPNDTFMCKNTVSKILHTFLSKKWGTRP